MGFFFQFQHYFANRFPHWNRCKVFFVINFSNWMVLGHRSDGSVLQKNDFHFITLNVGCDMRKIRTEITLQIRSTSNEINYLVWLVMRKMTRRFVYFERECVLHLWWFVLSLYRKLRLSRLSVCCHYTGARAVLWAFLNESVKRRTITHINFAGAHSCFHIYFDALTYHVSCRQASNRGYIPGFL